MNAPQFSEDFSPLGGECAVSRSPAGDRILIAEIAEKKLIPSTHYSLLCPAFPAFSARYFSRSAFNVESHGEWSTLRRDDSPVLRQRLSVLKIYRAENAENARREGF
jgi:hypothetical protein